MLTLVFYLSLTAIGVIGAFFSPLIGAIACIEAYLLNPNALGSVTIEIRYQLITTVAFIAACLIRRPTPLPRAEKERRLMFRLWIFVALALASCSWAQVSAAQGFDLWFSLFKTVVWLPFLIRIVRTEEDMSKIVVACVIGVWHASFMHVLGPRLGYVAQWRSREYGVLDQGQTAVLILFVPLLVLLAAKGSKWERLVAIPALPFVLDSIVGSYQRVGLVALMVEAILLLILLPRRVTLTILPVLAVAGALFVTRFTPDNWWKWMSTIQEPSEEVSANSRSAINNASLRMLADYPYGVGFRNYLDVSPRYLDDKWLDEGRRSAHNTYFETACELGIQGLLAWILAFGGAVLQLRRIRKRAGPHGASRIEIYAMAFEIGLYGWFVAGFFHNMALINPAFWFLAFAVILARLQRQRDTESEVVDENSPAHSEVPA